jgi:hypothetical protein
MPPTLLELLTAKRQMSDSMNKQATIDRLRMQLAQAEADRDVLAAEVGRGESGSLA